jgi:DNA-binding GntR family transcriptional regulator
MNPLLARHPLRDDVHRAILERLIAGSYAPGARLKDTVLAYDLGVSRTPVREALMRLQWEGFLTADMGRGFRVRPLTTTDAQDAYPELWTLEQLAIRISSPPSPDSLGSLDALSAELAHAAAEPERQLAIDAQWHDEVVSACPNARLLASLATLRAVAHRYERALLRHADTASLLARDHRAIIQSLGAGNAGGAESALERHWRWRMERVLAGLAST